MNILLRLIPFIRKVGFLEFLNKYRTKLAGVISLWSGVMGVIFGAIPIPSGDGLIIWTPIDIDIAWGMVVVGLTILGIEGKFTKLMEKKRL